MDENSNSLLSQKEMEFDDIILTAQDLISVLMVYTTRLDQMAAFKQIPNRTVKDVTAKILAESKPHYKPLPKNETGYREHCESGVSYSKLCNAVQQLNDTAKAEAQQVILRNKNLLRMCKPLEIKLEDIQTQLLQKHKLQLCDRWSMGLTIDLMARDGQVAQTAGGNTTLVTKNTNTREAEIYTLDAFNNVTSYHRTDMNKSDALSNLHTSKDSVLLEYCCWVSREKHITNFMRSKLGSTVAASFLRQQHCCPPRPCGCCCAFRPASASRPHQEDFLLPANTEPAVQIGEPEDSIVTKARNYFPSYNIPGSGLNAHHRPTEYLKNAMIIFKYAYRMSMQLKFLGETYEIGASGDVVSYVRPTEDRSVVEEEDFYKKENRALKKVRALFSSKVCCWYNRSSLVAELYRVEKLSPSACKFMRTPHPCGSFNCICCCKPADTSLGRRKEKEQSMINIISQPQRKASTELVQQSTVDSDSTNSNISADLVKLLRAQKKSSSAPRKYRRASKPKTMTPLRKLPPTNLLNQNTTHDTSHLTTDPRLGLAGRPPLPRPAPAGDCAGLVNGSLGPAEDASSVTAPLALVNSILGRFKNFTLCVNESNILTAVINTTEKLNSEEIKVLSDILSLATVQIAQLGITPADFCERVNHSRTERTATGLVPSNRPSKAVSKSIESIDPLENMVQTKSDQTSSVYRMMSSLGSRKNKHLVGSFLLHFQERAGPAAAEPPMPRIADTFSLASAGDGAPGPRPSCPSSAASASLVKRKQRTVEASSNKVMVVEMFREKADEFDVESKLRTNVIQVMNQKCGSTIASEHFAVPAVTASGANGVPAVSLQPAPAKATNADACIFRV